MGAQPGQVVGVLRSAGTLRHPDRVHLFELDLGRHRDRRHGELTDPTGRRVQHSGRQQSAGPGSAAHRRSAGPVPTQVREADLHVAGEQVELLLDRHPWVETPAPGQQESGQPCPRRPASSTSRRRRAGGSPRRAGSPSPNRPAATPAGRPTPATSTTSPMLANWRHARSSIGPPYRRGSGRRSAERARPGRRRASRRGGAGGSARLDGSRGGSRGAGVGGQAGTGGPVVVEGPAEEVGGGGEDLGRTPGRPGARYSPWPCPSRLRNAVGAGAPAVTRPDRRSPAPPGRRCRARRAAGRSARRRLPARPPPAMIDTGAQPGRVAGGEHAGGGEAARRVAGGGEPTRGPGGRRADHRRGCPAGPRWRTTRQRVGGLVTHVGAARTGRRPAGWCAGRRRRPPRSRRRPSGWSAGVQVGQAAQAVAVAPPPGTGRGRPRSYAAGYQMVTGRGRAERGSRVSVRTPTAYGPLGRPTRRGRRRYPRATAVAGRTTGEQRCHQHGDQPPRPHRFTVGARAGAGTPPSGPAVPATRAGRLRRPARPGLAGGGRAVRRRRLR